MTSSRTLVSLICALCLCGWLASCAQEQTATSEPTMTKDSTTVPPVLDFTMRRIDGEPAHLADYQGKVVLIVNVASECGLTPQYEQLQKLHETYRDRGLAVLGFPANNFGGQEPGTDAQIIAFCDENFGVTFDMFSKVSVKGEDICPLYEHLTSETTNPDSAGDIQWNFEKFIISRDGRVAHRFAPRVEPDSEEVVAAIERELG